MIGQTMDTIDQWLAGFDAFSDESVGLTIKSAEEEAAELRERADMLLTRAASLRILLEARQKAQQQNARVRPPAAEAKAVAMPPTIGQVLSGRSPNGTSQAILDLMRTAPDSDWPISEILSGLAANERLPTSSDPRRAVDATLHRLTKVTQEIERKERGVYRLSKSPLNEPVETIMTIGSGPR